MTCPLCKSDSLEIRVLECDLVRHMDFATVAARGTRARCRACSLIFSPGFAASDDQFREVCRSEAYASSGITHHAITARGFASPVTRMVLQAELLSPLLTTGAPRVLDIGCHDGLLLEELSKRTPAGFFHGQDINEHVRSRFPQSPRFTFSSAELSAVEGSYDLIVLSHSLMYFADLSSLLSEIRRLLKTRGMLFIQAPDIAKNPWALLYADQCSFYCRENVTQLLARAGCSVHFIDSEWFPRELLAYGHKEDLLEVQPIETGTLSHCLAYLDSAAGLVREAAKLAPDSPLAALGTTVNAAWVDGILGNRLVAFVDEDSHKIGHEVRGKPVVHPAALQAGCTLVIPYRESSARIREQWETKYPHIVSYLCV